jgi:transposase
MREGTAVGLDVHARSVWAATLDCVTGEVCSRRVEATCEGMVEWARGLPGPVRVAYEAGPTGFGLARALEAAGIACVVAAPSKLERAPGDRVKTDRRDAELLARRVRSGELVSVRVPTEDEEAARDLVRAREHARGDLMRARHRLSKLLLRRGLVYDGAAWTHKHERWLAQLRFERRGVQLAFDEAQATVLGVQARRERLDRAISEMAAEPAWRDCVGRLCCLRGVGVLTAFALTVGSATGIASPAPRSGSYLGLVPSEDSSGQRHSRACA